MAGAVQGILYALLGFALFSTHDVVVKLLGGDYSSFQIVFFSVLFGFPLCSVVLMRDAQAGTLIPKHPYWTLARTIAVVVSNACAFYAFSVLPLADAYAIFFATPLIITVLAVPLLGEKVRLPRALAVLVGLVGVGIVLQPGQAPLTLGHFAAVGAALTSAFGSVVVRKIGRDERRIVLLLYPMMANFVLMGLLMPFSYVPVEAVHLGMLFAVACLSFAAMFCMIHAYSKAEAAVIAPMQYSQIIWAALAGWFLFGEVPGSNTMIGALVIILSGLFIVFREARPGGTSQQPVLRTRNRIGTPSVPRLGPLLKMRQRGPRPGGIALAKADRG